MELRVSTWNCFGMGQGLGAITAIRAPHGARFRDEDVLGQCSSADVLCVQELFSREAQRFFDEIGRDRYTARFRDDNRFRFATMRGSGLGLMARAGLVRTVLEVFPGPCVGWDRLARKGALYAELVLDGGLVLDVITAHLQAGHDIGAIRVRAVQLSHLRSLVDRVGSAERPMIVCGDLNIDGLADARADPEYARLAAAFADFEDLGAAADLPTFHPHPEKNALAHAFEPDGKPQRIDYVLWRRGPGLECTGLTRFFDQPLVRTAPSVGAAAWASDHYGLTATFERP